MAGRALLVFAKAPEPGRAKTRLIPALGPEGAARLARRLLEHTVEVAAGLEAATVELHGAPHGTHPAFESLQRRFPGLRLREQAGGDLGARMYHALSRAFRRHHRVVLVGTDCPALGRAYLRRAFAALDAGADLVLGPAADGGYVLIGCGTPPDQRLFTGIAWGTSQVLAQTRERIRALGYSWHELPCMRDVDEPDDLAVLSREWWGVGAPENAGPA